jgi:hypothetical protein
MPGGLGCTPCAIIGTGKSKYRHSHKGESLIGTSSTEDFEPNDTSPFRWKPVELSKTTRPRKGAFAEQNASGSGFPEPVGFQQPEFPSGFKLEKDLQTELENARRTQSEYAGS